MLLPSTPTPRGAMRAKSLKTCWKTWDFPRRLTTTPSGSSSFARLGSRELPLAEFYSPFLDRLPSWGEQSELERKLYLLFDDLDHAVEPSEKDLIAARMREVVRDGLS
jgi:hypothetical protein